jgi:hypothetical protein
MVALVAALAAGCSAAPLVGGNAGFDGGSASFDAGNAGFDSGSDLGGASCDQLVAWHAVALTEALVCTPGAPNQCQALAEVVPLACPTNACENYEYVNDVTRAKAFLGSWYQSCVPSDPCSEVLACIGTAPRATCVPTSPGASTGTCTPSPSDGVSTVAPDGGESCYQLSNDYTAAVRAALACTPGASNQCQAQVTPNLFPCGDCQTMEAANDATAVNAIWQRWAAQCADTADCLQVGCHPPPGQTGVCVPVDGGPLGGICVNSTPTD